MDKDFMDGVKAFHRGVDITSRPFMHDPNEEERQLNWEAGWYHERNQLELLFREEI
jgi:hypothetical protein